MQKEFYLKQEKPRYNKDDVLIPVKGFWAQEVLFIKVLDFNLDDNQYMFKVLFKGNYDYLQQIFINDQTSFEETTVLNTKAGKILYGKET